MESLTLTGLLKDVAGKFPHRRAISVSGKFDVTHSRLDQLVELAASRLVRAGVSPGDVVALTFPNNLEYIISFLAVARVRAIAAPLNPAYTAEEFEFYLSDSESKLLLTSADGNKQAEAAAAKLNLVYSTVSLINSDSELSFSATLPESNSVKSVTGIVNESSDIGLFLHTSGTTSRPKGVPLSQLNLVSSVRNIRSVYRLSECDSTVIVLPLFHVHGLIAGLLSSLGSGGSVTLPSAGRFSASSFWSDMKSYNATWYTAVPTIHQIILDRHLSKPESEYPKLRFIRSCSASLAPTIMDRLEESFGAPVLEAYAMTEASHLMCSNPLPEDGPHKPGSVGKPVGQELAILDENGLVQKAGSKGEVCIRGPNVTKGYKNNPEANKAAFQFGWFHTGDVGYVDEDGYLHLVGRIKELINRGGEKISPIEVDAVLLSHPDVAQAVAFGVPDDKYGEEIFHRICHMTFHINAVCETYYDILSLKENASDEEIRLGYRHALLSCHPDKLHTSTNLSNPAVNSKDQFLKVQKAWEILSNPRSKALYDNELRASRSDVMISDEICIEDMMAEDNGGSIELYHQCRCGDYFSFGCSQLEEMGYLLVRDDCEILVRIPNEKSGSIILPCSSCSLRIHLFINDNDKIQFADTS